MKIIIVGCGKIGCAIARDLSGEKGLHVTVVDRNPDIFDNVIASMDIRFVVGNGLNEKTLLEAGAKNADLIVATTGADEENILCCIIAKHLGTAHAAARVRNPDYALDFHKLWKNLGIDTIINPEYQTAREISRLLRYQSADAIDTFVGGRVELVSFRISEAPGFFVGKSVSQIFTKKMGILVAVVERNNMALIPHGDLVFEKSDVIRIIGRPSNIMSFFVLLGIKPKKNKEVVIIGGGKITHYLTELLSRHTMKSNIKIIEKDREICEVLSETLGLQYRCLVIHGDGTNEDVLLSEDISQADAVICLTGRDEENAIVSLYASQLGIKKVITKINHINQNMVKFLGLSSIVTPQNITSDYVTHYVKGLVGAVGRNSRTMHKIFDGGDGPVEAIEFQAPEKAKCLNTPLKDLKLKKGILIGCIVRAADIIVPSGETHLQPGDSVIVIAKANVISGLDDILLS